MIHEQSLKEIISDQRNQLNNKNNGIPREVDYKHLVETPFITVISGIRRSGKSTLMYQLTKYFNEFYYVNFDDERFFDFDVSDFSTLLLVLNQFTDSKTIFVDEIQNIPSWERFIRRIYDEGYKIFITGSNSKLLSSELSTHLTGRYIKVELFPFSFTEYLTFHKIDFLKLDSVIKAQILKYFDKYIEEGGFPEYSTYADIQQLQNIYEDIIYKDLIARFGIKNTKALKQLAHYYFTNFTNEVSYNSLKSILGIKSINTIRDYVEYLQQAYLLFECYKFDYSLKKQITYSKKAYVIDNGLRNKISFRFNTDVGKLLENVVYLHLRKLHEKVWFYKTTNNYEVDFIVEDGASILYQVSYNIDDKKTLNRETRSLLLASNELNTNNLFLLTYNTFDTLIFDNALIKVMPVWFWLIETTKNLRAGVNGIN